MLFALAMNFALAVLLVFMNVGVAGAEPLRATMTATAEEGGYGRLVLTFPERSLLPQYDALVANNVLRVTFHEPIDVDVGDVPARLGDFVSIARQDPDGMAVRFALIRDLRINTMEAGEKLFIDLLPSGWDGPPPRLPDSVIEELAKRAEAALKKARALEQARLRGQTEPKVDLRIGSHPTFTRLSFQWNIAFDSAFIREEDIVRVTFNHDASLDLSDLRAHLPPGIVDATSFADDGKLKFLLRLGEGVNVRAFREDNAYVVDVTPDRENGDPINQLIDAELAPPVSPDARDVVETTGRPARDSGEEKTAGQTPKAQPEAKLSHRTGQSTSGKRKAADGSKSAEPVAANAAAKTPQSAGNGEGKGHNPDERDVSGEPVPSAIDLTALENAKRSNVLREVNPESPPEDYGEDARRFVGAEARRIGNTVRVVFPFSEPVSSAIFRRYQSIWLVFDTDDPVDIRGMRSVLGESAEEVEIEEFEGWQSVRIDLAKNALATVAAEDGNWILTLGETIVEPSRPLQIKRNVRNDGGTILHVPIKEPQHVRRLKDPFVGDEIVAVTAFGPSRGLIKPQAFVELDALMSAHGVALRKKAEYLDVKIDGDAVRIEGPRGLHLSNEHLQQGTRILETIIDPDQPGQINLGALMTASTPDFLTRAKNLQFKIASTPEGERRGPRMDLARFYLAHGLAQESLAMMHLAAEDDPAIERDASFNLMLGAAQILAGRPKVAENHLNRPELRNSPDAAVWQTIASATLSKWNEARLTYPRGSAVIGNYPVSVENEFNLSAAETLVESNDFGEASQVLSEVDPSAVSPGQAARYDLLRGRIADASGRSREALTSFDLVRRSIDRPHAAEAAYRSLRIRYRDGEIGTSEAIEQLAGLATSWRGDETELKTLRLLSKLQVKQGNYRAAFESMKAAVLADPDSPTTRLLQEDMNAVFASLYLDGKANGMDPVEALALFYDFRELTPVGHRGDAMVRHLASRLISVDLLEQAAELLQHQVENRLKGAARAQIAADLGVVHLMNGKPEETLRVLNRTRQAQLPRTLTRQRNIVEARALTESGRPDLALEIVRNMRGEDVERLRADTYWAAGRFRDAGEQLEEMSGSRWGDNVPLSDRERSDVLRAAVAYSLAEDQFSLDRLRTKFAPKMADGPQGKAFEVATRPINDRGVEFLSVADSLEQVDSLDIFLSEYQRKYLRPAAGQLVARSGKKREVTGEAKDVIGPAAAAGDSGGATAAPQG
ncbi:hypothetical protein GR183_02315 [Stappia sp. GBMRC 2046]|uniref:Tetratricopeptide repeat-containing protein n=1 Tax=Stappia sediminis TaxID=2692190 RepID=A0A7X3LRG6_9HYPH|nr:hypothetical protein [Stappia sediminis]MXN63726.1 hypothetical protein [Stappia sediminis]